ncbi:MAG: ankyrin repeat domain-containing protein, partial [Planctomycetota bacterium]
EETLLYLDDGKLSAHITWQSVGDGTSSWYYLDGVDENGDDFFQKSGTYAATKHIARWVRPGSNLVESSMTNRDLDGSGGGRVIAAAFETAENDANTVVLTNRAQFDREVVINLNNFDTHGMGGDNWRAYFTEEADNGQQETWVRLASQDGTGEVPLTVSPDGTSISFVMPARSMLTLTNIDGEPIDAVEADATRIYQYAQQGIGLQRMSYFHRVVGVGWQQGVLQEITDSRMLQVFEPSGRNVLHLAAGINNGDITNTLSHVLDRAEILGMDINAQGFDGMTPLMIASASQMAGISFTTDVGGIFLVQPEDTRARINTLIDAGGDLHVKDDHGRTALHWSAITARAEVSTTIDVVSPHTKLLLEQGADANKVDAFGRTAYDWALLEGNPEAAAELAAWTTDTAAPELLAVESQMSGSYIGATLTFDEAIGTVSDGDFVLVRDDGTTAATRIRSVTTLAGGNTQVVVEAVDGMFLPAGHWRVYPTGNVQDLAGNAFELPPESRGMFGFSSAELDYLPADFDGDQAVTLADFAILRANFNSPGLTGGDANGDGWVNLIDFALLRTSFGVSLIGGPDGDFGGRESSPAMDIIADFAGGLDDGNGFDSGPSNRSVAAYSPTSDTPFSRGGLFDADDEV